MAAALRRMKEDLTVPSFGLECPAAFPLPGHALIAPIHYPCKFDTRRSKDLRSVHRFRGEILDFSTKSSDWSGVEAVARHLLEHLETEAESVATMLRRQMVPYAALSMSEILPGVSTSMRFGIAALKEHRLPDSEELEQLADVAETRAHQEIPLELVLSAYRLGAHELWRTASDEGQRRGVRASTLLEAIQCVWAWTDAVTAHAAGAHRRAELELARHHQQRQTNFLHALITGSLSGSELSSSASVYGLDLQQRYRAFRVQSSATVPLTAVERSLIESGALVVGIIDGALSGISAGRLRSDGSQVAVGLGPPVELASFASSFTTACQVLRSATSFSLTGVFDVEDLRLRIPLATEDTVGDLLVQRYLSPLRALRNAGAGIEEGIEVLLSEGMRIEPASRRLFIHPNTLRYRLGKFQEVTGADLGKTETLVEVWWAFERQRVQRSAAGAGGQPSPPERADGRT